MMARNGLFTKIGFYVEDKMSKTIFKGALFMKKMICQTLLYNLYWSRAYFSLNTLMPAHVQENMVENCGEQMQFGLVQGIQHFSKAIHSFIAFSSVLCTIICLYNILQYLREPSKTTLLFRTSETFLYTKFHGWILTQIWF